MSKPKIVVILGQTATGKSDLAVKIARKINGEIISADSRQVYKGLDIGTGKITKREMQGVPHFLLDVVNPKRKFTVIQYKKLADRTIKEIISRGHTPIIIGGTGFYIEAITRGIILPDVKPDQKLRKILGKKPVPELFRILKKLDLARAKSIDPQNKVRVIRAIEIAKKLGKVPKIAEVKPLYRFIKIGLCAPSEIIKEKIQLRLLARIRKGMIEEAKTLHENGLSWRRMEELGLEYRYLAMYLQDKITKAEMIGKLNTEIYRYSKRQITWFRRDSEIKWLDASKNIPVKEIIAGVKKD